MNFEKTPPTWNAEGSEPPSSLKTSGFKAGYKPPAAYFNWFWNRVSACLTELQTKLSNVDNTKDADKSVKYASTSGSANKTKGSMVVRLNGGSTEGTDLFTFDGSTGKSVNITPSKIGAASESKLPFWATYGTTTNAEIETAYQAGKQVLVKTTDGYVGELFARLSSGKAHFFCAGVKIYRCFNGNWTDLSDSYGFTPTVHASTHKKGGSDPIKPEDIGAAAASNGTVLSQNADYAEVGQWADGNPNSENRIGYFVAIDDTQAGTTMVKATSTKDVRGVVVTAPAFSGNCSSDKFDSDGNLLKQYAYVAVMGLVSVIDNGTCTINGRCMPNDSGTAVPSSNNLGYQVIDRIDDTHILIAVEPGADMIQRIRTDVANRYTKKETDVLLEGKAPAGYGLGGAAKLLTSADDLNDIWETGCYTWENDFPAHCPTISGQKIGWCSMLVVNKGGPYSVHQIAFTLEGYEIRRDCKDTWDDWYWNESPTNDAHPTAELYNGKRIYKRLLNNTIQWSIDNGVTWKNAGFYLGDGITKVPQINVTVAAEDLASYLASLPRLVVNDLFITVSAGTCAEKIVFNGFYGPGRIWIKTDGGLVLCTAGLIVTQARCHVIVNGLTIRGGPVYDGSVVCAYASSHVELENCVIDGQSETSRTGVIATCESTMSMKGCTIRDTTRYAAEASVSSVLSITDTDASGNSIGGNVWRGGIMLLCGSTPQVLGGAQNRKAGGVFIANGGTLL